MKKIEVGDVVTLTCNRYSWTVIGIEGNMINVVRMDDSGTVIIHEVFPVAALLLIEKG